MADSDVAATGVFVGIDSGGTRTNIQTVVDDGLDEPEVSNYEIGKSLSGSLTPKLISSVIRRIFAPLDAHFEQLGVRDLPCFAWISAAGYSPWTRDNYISALEELGPSLKTLSIRVVGIANDSVSLHRLAPV